MSETRFDPASGTLALSDRALLALCRISRDPATIDAESMTELATAGIVTDSGLDPRLASVALAMAEPFVRLRLDHLVWPGLRIDGWLGERVAVLLTRDRPEAEVGLASVLPWSLVPMAVARALRLGPRAGVKVDEAVEVDAGSIEALLAGTAPFTGDQVEALLGAGDELLPVWVEALASLSHGIRARWTAGVWWNSHHERPRARSLDLIDSDAGLFLVTPRPRGPRGVRRVELRPLTPTHLWLLFCALLPDRDDVAEPLAP